MSSDASKSATRYLRMAPSLCGTSPRGYKACGTTGAHSRPTYSPPSVRREAETHRALIPLIPEAARHVRWTARMAREDTLCDGKGHDHAPRRG